jgi:hypothetical protein
MTREPASTCARARVPMIATTEIRIATVLAGTRSPAWRALACLQGIASAPFSGIAFVARTVSGDADSTTATAIAMIASPAANATRTLRISRAAPPSEQEC